MKTIKLSEWCDKRGVSYLTAWRWFKKDKMPVKAYQTETGTILVEDEDDIFASSIEADQDNALSVFLKKTIEFSKNESSVEDFAAYIISNFQLKLIGQDQPKYSRNKPKSEEVQKHFKNFIPTAKKPEPFVFIPEPEVWENLTDNTENFVGTNDATKVDQGLVNEIRENDEGVLVTPIADNVRLSVNGVQDLQSSLSGKVSFSSSGTYGSMTSTSYGDTELFNLAVTGDGITYSDLNPQNYTYSTNAASSNLLGSSLSESPVFVNLYNALHDPGPGLTEKPKRGRPRKKNND
jgi:hypothetical protein